jgi:hypothetical protein
MQIPAPQVHVLRAPDTGRTHMVAASRGGSLTEAALKKFGERSL